MKEIGFLSRRSREEADKEGGAEANGSASIVIAVFLTATHHTVPLSLLHVCSPTKQCDLRHHLGQLGS